MSLPTPKPCPFCDGRMPTLRVYPDDERGAAYAVMCKRLSCMAQGPAERTLEDAWAKWNARSRYQAQHAEKAAGRRPAGST